MIRDLSELEFKDKYGESIVVVFYDDTRQPEKRVRAQLYWVGDTDEHENYMLEHDIQLDISLEELSDMIEKIRVEINEIKDNKGE